MTAPPTKPSTEQTPAMPSFSYAQAAKGKTTNPTSDMAVSSIGHSTNGMPQRAASSDASGQTQPPEKLPTKRAASEGRMPTQDISSIGSRNQTNGLPDSKKAERDTHALENDTTKDDSVSLSSETRPAPSSIVPKEEGAAIAINGSSESKLEETSQTSQNGTKVLEIRDGENPPETEAVAQWDEEAPIGPNLKEAPPPTMNIWQQRIETQAAKTKLKQPVPLQSSPVKSPSEQDQSTSTSKGADESKKLDNKRKPKSTAEERPQPESARNGNKDRKAKPANDDKAAFGAMAPPPPPGDAVSWPTPESATVEEKKKTQPVLKSEDLEKEKEAPTKTKASGRKAWTQMDFVPTAVFETHVPQSRRGGRGPSGGRENPPRGRHNGTNNRGERPGNISTPSTPQTATDDSRTSNLPSTAVQFGNRAKRASSAGPTSSKEQRKYGDTAGLEKTKESSKEDSRNSQSRRASGNDTRKPQSVPVPATPQISIPAIRPGQSEAVSQASQVLPSVFEGESKADTSASEYYPNNKNAMNNRKTESSNKSNDLSKEAQTNGSVRDREERSNRARNGRGRGSANHVPQNGAPFNGAAYPANQGFGYQQPYTAPSRSFSNHERTPSQTQTPWYGTSPHRNVRSGSRSQYPSTWVPMGGRFSHGSNGGPSHLSNIQTDLANMHFYPQGPQGVMSAIPYNAYEEQLTVYDMVQLQMEYYFSVDNLCKDMFLRKHMDSQGFVFLSVLTGFNRIVSLTTDIEIIRYVCLNSQKIEFKPGQVWQDGRDRLRARDGWTNFVLPKDQRDSTAQTDGPVPAPINHHSETRLSNDEKSPTRNVAKNSAADFPFQSLNAMAPGNGQTASPAPPANGLPPNTSHAPLSAAVSEFSPAAHSHTSRRFASPDSRQLETKPFSDEEIQNLQIFVRHSFHTQHPPLVSASTRTFSNGSIDGGNLNEELSKVSERQPRSTNGEVFENERSARSRSPFMVNSPSRRQDLGRSPPVFWLKHKEDASAVESSPKNLALEPYLDFRRDALLSREQAPTSKSISNMQNLYNFWAHFLIRNFNRSMYEEFRQLALEDQQSLNSSTGMQNLMQYYHEALLGQRVILDDVIARHYVELVRTEDRTEDRPAFKKLRTAWRNGAFNHMNRHKILKLIDNDLRDELDR